MANIQYYDVILKPVITEKSMNAMAEKKYTFLVHPEANRSEEHTLNSSHRSQSRMPSSA